ncbi:hypothetical protein CLV47_101351 [Antricoccus suffuscus]|uniref:YdbS-like PH domain-containing protein n=2 Tax=Antricoccus suffuscus TaxID=1629062 RepID=A0A2T1A6K6_9ACTN|nr:hypothetical protein CLV47_101351 [Antricoccus suffuscus]
MTHDHARPEGTWHARSMTIPAHSDTADDRTDFALRPPAYLVSKRAIWYWTARTPLRWIPVIVAQVIWWVIDDGDSQWRWPIAIATLVLLALNTIIEPQWRYRVHRWEVTDTAVYTQSGWFTQERRIAPLSRVQTVDLERGPIQQLFKLAEVTVTTASAAGPLKITGLDRPVAEQVIRDLTASAEAAQDDAT